MYPCVLYVRYVLTVYTGETKMNDVSVFALFSAPAPISATYVISEIEVLKLTLISGVRRQKPAKIKTYLIFCRNFRY